MERKEFRVPIKRCYLRGKTSKKAKEKLDKYYGTFVVHLFGRTSTSDELRPERPSDVTTIEMIKKILRLVTDDRKLKVREISKFITANYWIDPMR